MPRLPMSLPLLVSLCVACFAAPRFRPPEAPTISWRVPAAPQAPSPLEGQRGPGGARTLTAARVLDDLRARTVAISLRAPEGVRERVWPALARQLLNARFTRVLPPSIMGLHGTVAAERSGARTQIDGDLQELLMLRADTPAEVLLAVEVATSAQVEEAEVSFEPGAVESYETAYGRFLTEVTRARQQLEGALATWADGVRQAEGEYVQRGGIWRDSEDVMARDRVAAFQSRAQAFATQLEGARAAAVSPADLSRRAASVRAASRAQVTSARLRATLTDLAAGQTTWMLELSAQRPDEASALADVVTRLVAELTPAAPGEAAAP